MKKFFTMLVFPLFLFVAQASADQFYTIADSWVDWPGYKSNVSGDDDLGTPEIKRMEITLSDSGILKNIDIVLESEGWQEFNSLFINSYALGSKDTQWDDWDYLVHDGGNTNKKDTIGRIPGNGIWTVNNSQNYSYTMTKETLNNGIRQKSPNGIDKSSLTKLNTRGTTWAFNGWEKNTNSALFFYSFDFIGLDIDLSDGAFIAFAPYCANDVIGGNMNPVPEPATMALLGIGLLGLAGVARRRVSR